MNPQAMAAKRVELLRKGWTIDEIEDAIRIMSDAQAHKGWFIRLLDKVVFWVNLILALIGNFVISVVMIPFMLFATPLYLYPSLFVVGVCFGALYDMVVFDIERIDGAPKIFVGPFLFAIAIINSYIITSLNNLLASRIGFEAGRHFPLFVAVIYTAGFLTPYSWTHWDEIMLKAQKWGFIKAPKPSAPLSRLPPPGPAPRKPAMK